MLGAGASNDIAASALPFGPGDSTAGSETELQAAVIGRRQDVDLPQSIERSKYYSNLLKRATAEDMPKRPLRDLQRFLEDEGTRAWEQSWVRFPRKKLSPLAQQVFDHDLLADKSDPLSGPRQDAGRFVAADAERAADAKSNDALVRLPISYLLKLALADVIGAQASPPAPAAVTGAKLLRHFLNDNISPETYSFYVASARAGESLGSELAGETSLRFLLTQFLTSYANERFGLRALGQQATVYFSPHPPTSQKQLNECISDSFYRELFTSPCLSGWDRGEEKHEYMLLCHQVLSRSQLHAAAKVVHDAGLIAGRLVVLPSLSNISLANNGIHVSLGSRRLSGLVGDATSGFGAAEEKCVGDLAIKVVEHFLPLFVGAYSAAPYRLDFADFHAERILGYLPHQLDYTHLRMFWRRWKKKAKIKLFGQPIGPTGYSRLDRLLSATLRLKGDFAQDFRLIDYMMAPLSTAESPALDGMLGNADRLKRDLADQGVYDTRMSLYMLYRQRAYAGMGFSGFEGRYYSLCNSLHDDLGPATDLQNLITALAYHYIVTGQITHADIPDDPVTESERRQIFFGAAAGIPTFFVRRSPPNALLKRILQLTQKTRYSHRYPGYLRVYNREYRRALIDLIRQDAPALVESLDAGPLLDDLQQRIESPHTHSAAGKLTRSILDELNVKSPLKVSAVEFNTAAERFYRDTLRRRHLREGMSHWKRVAPREALPAIERLEGDALAERLDGRELQRLINLLLETIHTNVHDPQGGRTTDDVRDCTPVC